MSKLIHEVRDGVHGFILFNQLEKSLIDSVPVQRLRCIHQLAMCYQVYPGASHKRKHPTILKELIQTAESEFDARNIRSDYHGPKSELNDFLVQTDDGGIESSLQVSGIIANLPSVEIGFVFAEPRISEKAKGRIDSVIREILSG